MTNDCTLPRCPSSTSQTRSWGRHPREGKGMVTSLPCPCSADCINWREMMLILAWTWTPGTGGTVRPAAGSLGSTMALPPSSYATGWVWDRAEKSLSLPFAAMLSPALCLARVLLLGLGRIPLASPASTSHPSFAPQQPCCSATVSCYKNLGAYKCKAQIIVIIQVW